MELLEASQCCRHHFQKSISRFCLSCSMLQLTLVVQSPFIVAQNQLKELYNKQVFFWTNKPGFPFNQLRIWSALFDVTECFEAKDCFQTTNKNICIFFSSASYCSSFAFPSHHLSFTTPSLACTSCLAAGWSFSHLLLFLTSIQALYDINSCAQNCNHPQTSPNISRSSQELLSRPEGFEQWIFSSILPVLPQPREPKHLPSTQLAQPHPGQHRQERSSLVEPKCTERCWKKTLMWGFKN